MSFSIWHRNNADKSAGCVYEMTTNGSVVRGSYLGSLSNINDMAVGPDDCIWLSNQPNEEFYRYYQDPSIDSDDSFYHGKDPTVGVDSTGYIYSGEVESGCVYSMYKLTDKGSTESSWYLNTGNVGGTAVDPNNSKWVSYYDGDNYNHSFYKLDQNMSPISSFATPSSSARGFEFDQNGCIWHADSDAGRIYKLNNQASAISSFSSPGSRPADMGVESTFAGAGGSKYTQLLDEAVVGRKN